MNLWFRLIWICLAALMRTRLSPLSISRIRLHVLPLDLDANLHMTNSRYHSVMDLGRMDMLIRTGLLPLAIRKRWAPVLGGTTIRFKRALRPFQGFDLSTRVLWWDAKWFYLEHRIEVDGTPYAVAVMKSCFLGPEGPVSPADIARALDFGGQPPPPPPWLEEWRLVEAGLDERTAV